MKYLPRELAFRKLEAMVAGARGSVRRHIAAPIPTASRCAAAT